MNDTSRRRLLYTLYIILGLLCAAWVVWAVGWVVMLLTAAAHPSDGVVSP